MKHFSIEQYTETLNRYLPLEEAANNKGLRLNFDISLYGNNDPSDTGCIRITRQRDFESLFLKTVSEAANTTEDDILGKDYYRQNYYHYEGLLAAFDAAEDFIRNYESES